MIHLAARRSTNSSAVTNNNVVTEVVEENHGAPVRLKIPKINVDAPIELMGLTLDGDMAAPSGPHPVGWYKFGARPGNKGTAVMDGHYGPWANGQVPVFNDINKLITGDKLYVEDEKGLISTFVVRELQVYDPGGDTAKVFSSSDSKSHLNLVTCEGVWDKTHRVYSNRLVVFTDKEIE